MYIADMVLLLMLLEDGMTAGKQKQKQVVTENKNNNITCCENILIKFNSTITSTTIERNAQSAVCQFADGLHVQNLSLHFLIGIEHSKGGICRICRVNFLMLFLFPFKT